ncbi:MAG: T9SS type A sorting domain-containing protein [Bacteroidetes bacterium]|nr:T9SS type A sorting domain-containing protein [Bacteroidota bacterium]
MQKLYAKHSIAILFRTRLLIVCCLLSAACCFSQSVPKIQGPLQVYRMAAGYCYNNTSGTDSLPIQDEFKFGELGIGNWNGDNGLSFLQEIDSCAQWKTNRAFGIIVPPSEGGVLNTPADTALYSPYPQSGSGEIQAGQRFSRLSQLYGGICGGYIDDFPGDTSMAHKVRDALRGKYVDANGNVHSDSIAHTPYNKLFVVKYSTTIQPSWMPVIDGISLWHYGNQSSVYTSTDTYINQLRVNFPGKEIHIGIYVDWGAGPSYSWASPASFQYMLQHGLNRYDDGDINGIQLFQGYWLVKPHTSLSIWNQYSFIPNLDSLYYPFLGMGEGKILDCSSGNPLSDVFLRVYCKGRVSGDTLFRSRQKTDSNGNYQFGLWAGNRTTDSTQYWLIAEKSGYINDTVFFWIKRLDTTFIPTISLCPLNAAVNEFTNDELRLSIYPNPCKGNLRVTINDLRFINSELEIYNVLGGKVYSEKIINQKSLIINLDVPNGIYFLKVNEEAKSIVKKIIINN